MGVGAGVDGCVASPDNNWILPEFISARSSTASITRLLVEVGLELEVGSPISTFNV